MLHEVTSLRRTPSPRYTRCHIHAILDLMLRQHCRCCEKSVDHVLKNNAISD